MTRSRARREPVPLEQIPVWDGFVADGPRGPDGDPPAGLDALLGGLNPEQLRAVTHGEGPLLVVAGAGTGKTQVITRRIAWLIATRRARPSEILGLTFTEKAAAEMQVRVDQLVPYGYTDTMIGTFHAFGDRLIREYALELGLPGDVRVLSRPEVVIFLRENLFAFDLDEYRPLGDPTRFLGSLATLFSRCKDEDVSASAYLAHARSLAERAAAEPTDAAAAEDARRQLELASAYARYQELLAANGFIDFGDQVALALQLVRTSAAARAEIQARFRFVLVDEFQDTNRAQSELVSIVAQPRHNLTVVGDDDQSIYRFRGAAISNILEFRERHGHARTIVLRRNYRSRPAILEASHRLIKFNDPDRLEVRAGISKRLVAERSVDAAGRTVRFETHATAGDEADRIATEIATRIATGDTQPRDVAILVRANGHADSILRSLDAAGVPWRFSGTSGLYSRPEVRRLLAFLRAIADLGSSTDVYAVATGEPYQLGGEDLTAIVTSARRRNRTLWDVLEELDRQPGLLRMSAPSRAAVARLVADLRRFSVLAHERPAGEVLYAFLRETGTLGRLAAQETVGAEEALRNISRFFDIIRIQSGLLADDRATFVARHLQTLIEAGDDPATADLDPDADAVAVLTVHKAKGLEFPIVYLPGLVAGRFPTPNRRDPLALPAALVDEVDGGDEVQIREERRLFYVAMTRARDELILSYAADYGGAGTRRPSPFLIEALDLPPASIDPAVRAASSLERIEAAGAAPVQPIRMRDPDAPTGEPLTLSFSAIDAYLSCPLKYKLGHVVRVPVPPHHAMIYGSALHKAVQEFHRRHARGDVMTAEDLIASFEAAWTNEGFLSRDHEEARLANGRETLLRFREAQLEPGAVIPAYVEREFSFSLGGDRVRGRWDRVDIEPADPTAGPGPSTPAEPPAPHADVVAPTLELTGRERVTITDYKTSDVREPAKARQRARDSLQLQIYAMGYEAVTGRLPDAVQLHFLDTGVIGRVDVEPRRLAKGRERIATAAAGIRARDFTPKPDRTTCGYCPFRAICPSSVAP
ncbi:MAG TPA: ATP-dependent DNA helicase [Candidatus Limnocylindrales bacterium]|nr:ATP-dependent DNA helicase [Candidatus Limnocylindrales bacterium]